MQRRSPGKITTAPNPVITGPPGTFQELFLLSLYWLWLLLYIFKQRDGVGKKAQVRCFMNSFNQQ